MVIKSFQQFQEFFSTFLGGKTKKSKRKKTFWFNAHQTHVIAVQSLAKKIGVEMKKKHQQMNINVLSLDFRSSHQINIKIKNIRPQTSIFFEILIS